LTRRTGGASGIAAASALKFARAGAAVAITDLPSQAPLAKAVLEKIKKEVPGAKAMWIEHDVTKAKDWERAVAETQSAFGPLDVLVHAAGICIVEGPIEDEAEEIYQRVMDVNVRGTFLGFKYAVRAMKENKVKESKSIVAFSSGAGIIGTPDIPVCGFISEGGSRASSWTYILTLLASISLHLRPHHRPILSQDSASKGAVRLLTKSTALRWFLRQLRLPRALLLTRTSHLTPQIAQTTATTSV